MGKGTVTFDLTYILTNYRMFGEYLSVIRAFSLHKLVVGQPGCLCEVVSYRAVVAR